MNLPVSSDSKALGVALMVFVPRGVPLFLGEMLSDEMKFEP